MKNLMRLQLNERNAKRLAFVCLGLLMLLQALHIWQTPFTSGDDALTSIVRFRAGGIWNAARLQAEGQGRFYALFSYYLAQIPYLIDAYQFRNSFSILCNIFAYIGFYFFVLAWKKDFWFSILSTSILVGLIEVRYGYNPFHGLPLWFSFAAGLLCFSFAFWALRSESRNAHLLSCFLFGISLLFYETFVLYSVFFLVFDLSKFSRSNFFSLRFLFNRYKGLLIVFVIYFSCYVIYMRAHPTAYSGTKVSLGTWHEMFQTVLLFSWHGWKVSLPSLADFSPLSFAFGVLVSFLIFIGLRRSSVRFLNLKSAFLIGIFVFLPNVLYALTERYREWVKGEPYYLGSYYSAFGLALAFSVLIFFILNWAPKKLYNSLVLVFSCLIGLYAVNNYKLGSDHFNYYRPQLHHYRLFELFFDDLKVKADVDNIVIVSPTLLPNRDPYDYWSTYLSLKHNRNIKIFAKVEDVPVGINYYYADFRLAPLRRPAFLVIGKAALNQGEVEVVDPTVFTENFKEPIGLSIAYPNARGKQLKITSDVYRVEARAKPSDFRFQ